MKNRISWPRSGTGARQRDLDGEVDGGGRNREPIPGRHVAASRKKGGSAGATSKQ